jgi:hypothetical protein
VGVSGGKNAGNVVFIGKVAFFSTHVVSFDEPFFGNKESFVYPCVAIFGFSGENAYLASERFGELRLGHGSTASDGVSEIDLSGTAVIGYSAVTDLAGGHFFFDQTTAGLTPIRVNNVFTNMDGLGRDDRILYETPELYGFTAETSWISDGAADVSLGYAAKLGPVAVGAAVAYASCGSNSAAIDNQVNGSVSVLHESGLNFTLAAGQRSFTIAGRDDATFY